MESNDYIEFEGVRRYQPDALHKRMLAKITSLEAALLARGEDCDRLQGTVKVQMDRIIELEAAQEWQPLVADEKHEQDGKEILIENQGEWVGIRRADDTSSHAWLGAWLSELNCVVMRKVQPAK